MTVTAAASPTSFSSQFSARATLTLASGVIGIVASGLLIAADQLRAWRMVSRPVFMFLFASHDVASIPQSLLFVPAAVMLSRRGRDQLSALGAIAVAALCGIAVLQLLLFMKIAPESLYMIPQGLLGVWLIVVNSVVSNKLRRHVRWTGILAGVGLCMIAFSLVSVIGYFGVGILSGAAPPADSQARLVNRVLHVNLDVGTWIGKPLYPIWVLLVARRLRWAPVGIQPDA